MDCFSHSALQVALDQSAAAAEADRLSEIQRLRQELEESNRRLNESNRRLDDVMVLLDQMRGELRDQQEQIRALDASDETLHRQIRDLMFQVSSARMENDFLKASREALTEMLSRKS